MLQHAANYARQLETDSRSPGDILISLRSSVDEGKFGALRQLLYPQGPVVAQPMKRRRYAADQEIQSSLEYPVYHPPVSYRGSQITTSPPFAGTVNPTTLLVNHDGGMAQSNFSEMTLDDLSRHSLDSVSTQPDAEVGPRYTYVISSYPTKTDRRMSPPFTFISMQQASTRSIPKRRSPLIHFTVRMETVSILCENVMKVLLDFAFWIYE